MQEQPDINPTETNVVRERDCAPNSSVEKIRETREMVRARLERDYASTVKYNFSPSGYIEFIRDLAPSRDEQHKDDQALLHEEVTHVAFDEIINFVSEKALDYGDMDWRTVTREQRFLTSVGYSLFGGDHGALEQMHPFSVLGVDRQLLLASKATRDHTVQEIIGKHLVRMTTLNMGRDASKEVPALVQRVCARPIHEVLDIVHQMQTIGVYARGIGSVPDRFSERVGQDSFIATDHTLEGIKERVKQPLVKYAVDLALERLNLENEDPFSLGRRGIRNREGFERVPEPLEESLDEESQTLRKQILPDVRHAQKLEPLRIASDAVGYFDSSVLPRYFGGADFANLPEEVEVPPYKLRHYEQNAWRVMGSRDVGRIASFIHSICYTTEELSGAKVWHEIYPKFSEQQWRDILLALESEVAGEVEDEAVYIGGDHRKRGSQVDSQTNIEPLFADRKNFLRGVVAYLEDLRTDEELRMQHIFVYKYEDIPKNQKLNPFTKPEDKDLPLLLQHLHRPEMRLKIERDLGVSLLDIPLRSQIHFLKYLSGQDSTGFDRVRKVLREKPEQSTIILKSFLANAEDPRYSEALLTLAERLDAKTASAVFGKYAEIADASERVRVYIQEHFGGRADFDQARVNSVVRELLHHGNEFLVQLTQGQLNDSEAVSKRLENIKTDIFMFASAFNIAAKTGRVELSDIAGIELISKDSSRLDEAEKKEMLRIYEENRPGYTPKLLKATMNELAQALESPGREFYILKNGGDIVAFIRFDVLDEGRLYAASLNVRPEVRGSRIGSATLDKKAETHDIEAVAYEKNPMLKHYLEDFGFKIAGKIPNYKNSGELFYKLERSRSTPKITLH